MYKYLSISMCVCTCMSYMWIYTTHLWKKEMHALIYSTYYIRWIHLLYEYAYRHEFFNSAEYHSCPCQTDTHTHTFLRFFWMILHLKTFTTWHVSDVLTWSSTLPLVQGSLPFYETPWSEWQSQTLGWHCGKLVEHVTKTTFLIVAKQTHPMICQSQVGHWRM